MALRSTHTVAETSLDVRDRRQTGKVGHGAASLGTTAMFSNAHALRINNSTLSVGGGDIHNQVHHHYHYEHKREIWAVLQLIPNFRVIYYDMLSKATSGTGVWLLKGDKFRLWLEPNGDIMIFWGSGIPGAGKTLLASIVIGHLEVLRRESDGAICVCYVYFRYGSRTEVTVRDVLAILVKQTLERHPDCRPLIENTYAQHLREGSEPTEAQLLELLRKLVDRMACAFYVLDALDEAPTRIQLVVVKALASLNVKLFITSRPLDAVEANFPQAHSFTITAQDGDIDLHIAKGLDESPRLISLIRQAGPSLREEIISTIKQKCGGMFLYASLQLEALDRCVSTCDVLYTLNSVPSKIGEVYLQTWDRILIQEPDHGLLIKVVFLWVINASRPMTIEELECAVATSPFPHKFEPNMVVPGATLMSLCHGLVTVQKGSRRVCLVHYTAKATLGELVRESFPHPHSLLASVCMAHLSQRGFQNTKISTEEEFRAALDEDPLLAYASEAWAFHACAGLNVEGTKRQTAQFIKKSNAFPAFTSLDHTRDFDILAPTHILGLYKLPIYLIEDAIIGGPNLTTTLRLQTSLMVASQFGHEGLVSRLIALPETQANLIDNDRWSALMAAAYAGQEGVIELLLAHPRIQVNLIDNFGVSALMLAASEGHQGIVKLLLAHPGIQVNLVDNNSRSALMLAAYAGHQGITILLLAYPGIQVNLVDNNSRSALMLAAYAGHEGIVILLLAYPGIQVNLIDNNGCSALLWATRAGQDGVVILLLSHPGIQVNLINNDGWSALMLAAYAGQEGVVILLLAYPGIQVNMIDDDGMSALMAAAYGGQEGVVIILLSHPGIQVNLVSRGGRSALMLAASHGYEGVVKLLLAHPEIQVSLVGEDGSTAFTVASFNGYESITRLLLATGDIDINSVDNNGDTPIKMAAYYGHEAVVRLLLDTPSINTTIRSRRDGHTAMSAAQARRHSVIVELLQTFESRQPQVVDRLGQLSLHKSTEEESSDSGGEDSYYDAEEGAGDYVNLGSSILS